MKRPLLLVLFIICICALLAAGCSSPEQKAPATPSVPAAPAQSPGDVHFARGQEAFAAGDYAAAGDLFMLAQENYTAAGDRASAIRARDMAFRAVGSGNDFPFNRSAIEAILAEEFPGTPAAERAAWLDEPMTATLQNGNETLYFFDTVHNIRNHHPELLQAENRKNHYTPMVDELVPLIRTPWKAGSGRYGSPVAYRGITELSIPRSELPADGILKIWMPVPIETGSQTNVSIIATESAKYVKSSTGTGADIGLVYLEIPLAGISDPFLNVSSRYRFVQHEQRVVVDPAQVKPYNTSSPEYLKYTATYPGSTTAEAIKAKALAIVGNETSPYLRAQKIYWNVVTTHPYSHAPHVWLDATGTPEADYVLKTGIGDCASQSMYFAALCRSLGIPARATGGYQTIMGSAGTHFWAEYYLEGYGWIPVDVTAAEGGDTSYNLTPEELLQYKAYLFGSLDPYRFVIQKDVYLPLEPSSGDALVSPSGWVQIPKISCDTCPEQPMLFSILHSKVTVTKE